MMKREGVTRECEHPGKPHEHGYAGYRFDECRCRICRAASAAEKRERYNAQTLGTWQSRLVDATGTRRRIQALMTLGYDMSWLCSQAGMSRKAVEYIIVNEQPKVRRDTEAAVRAVYEKHWDKLRVGTDTGTKIAVSMTVRRANKRGYLPPMAWDDDTIDNPAAQPELPTDDTDTLDWVLIERAMNGQDVELSQAERSYVAAALLAAGMSKTQVSKRLGMNTERVKRIQEERQAA